MRTYIIRRLLLVIPTLLIASLIIFFAIRFIPGDIIDLMVEEVSGGGVPLDRTVIEHELGLDVPVFTQYGRWMGVWPQDDGSFNGVLQGNLGHSLWANTPVVNSVIPRVPR